MREGWGATRSHSPGCPDRDRLEENLDSGKEVAGHQKRLVYGVVHDGQRSLGSVSTAQWVDTSRVGIDSTGGGHDKMTLEIEQSSQ